MTGIVWRGGVARLRPQNFTPPPKKGSPQIFLDQFFHIFQKTFLYIFYTLTENMVLVGFSIEPASFIENPRVLWGTLGSKIANNGSNGSNDP